MGDILFYSIPMGKEGQGTSGGQLEVSTVKQASLTHNMGQESSLGKHPAQIVKRSCCLEYLPEDSTRLQSTRQRLEMQLRHSPMLVSLLQALCTPAAKGSSLHDSFHSPLVDDAETKIPAISSRCL